MMNKGGVLNEQAGGWGGLSGPLGGAAPNDQKLPYRELFLKGRPNHVPKMPKRT